MERLSIVIPNVLTIRLRNSSDPVGCHGRTASYPTAPAQIPACGTTALGSSEILASVKDKIVIAFFAIPCREVCICSSSPTCPANVSFAGYVFCQPFPLFHRVLLADPNPYKPSVSLSFYWVDLPFDKGL